MIEVATDRNSLAKGVEIYVNIARMLFETLEGQGLGLMVEML